MSAMTYQEMDEYLLSYPGAWLDHPFGENVSVYKYGHDDDGAGKMFALVDIDSSPLRVSLKCDPGLAEMLREKYESVLPGFHLNKKHWNTILCSGQLDDDELQDLIRHSYQLVAGQTD